MNKLEKIILAIMIIPYSILIWNLAILISDDIKRYLVIVVFISPIILAIMGFYNDKSDDTGMPESSAKNEEKNNSKPVQNLVKEGPCVEQYWTLMDFIKRFDRMKVGNCTNHTTGEVFKCCMFFKGSDITFVYFYKDIGVLTVEEINKRKYKLKVGINVNNTYYLYAGKESFPQSIDLEI